MKKEFIKEINDKFDKIPKYYKLKYPFKIDDSKIYERKMRMGREFKIFSLNEFDTSEIDRFAILTIKQDYIEDYEKTQMYNSTG